MWPYLHRSGQKEDDEIFVRQSLGDHRRAARLRAVPVTGATTAVPKGEHEDHHADHGRDAEDEGEEEGGTPLSCLHLNHVHFITGAGPAFVQTSLKADSLQ